MHRMRWERVSLPAFALVGLLILLGHDTLMAANPHAPASPHADQTVGYEPAETDCGVTEGARPSAPDTSDLQAPAAPQPARWKDHHLVFIGAAAWHIDPTHPPDVLRAFLQVYLN